MKCRRCESEVILVVDTYAVTAELECECRVVMLSILGVMDDAEWKPTDHTVAGLAGDSGGGGETAGRDDSAETSNRIEEAAAPDESEIGDLSAGGENFIIPGGE